MADKVSNNYILYLKEKEVDEDLSNLQRGVEQLKRDYAKFKKQSFFKLSDKHGNIIAYIGEGGDVYVTVESELVIEEIQAELEEVTELNIPMISKAHFN